MNPNCTQSTWSFLNSFLWAIPTSEKAERPREDIRKTTGHLGRAPTNHTWTTRFMSRHKRTLILIQIRSDFFITILLMVIIA